MVQMRDGLYLRTASMHLSLLELDTILRTSLPVGVKQQSVANEVFLGTGLSQSEDVSGISPLVIRTVPVGYASTVQDNNDPYPDHEPYPDPRLTFTVTVS